MRNAWQQVPAGNAWLNWLVLLFLGVTVVLTLTEEDLPWTHGFKKHHHKHHDHDRQVTGEHGISHSRTQRGRNNRKFLKEDELVEVTPTSIRLRKKILEGGKRPKNRDKMDD